MSSDLANMAMQVETQLNQETHMVSVKPDISKDLDLSEDSMDELKIPSFILTSPKQLQILTDELPLSEGSSDKDAIVPHPTQVTAINTNEPKDIPKITTPL
jgi:hypothetical protein